MNLKRTLAALAAAFSPAAAGVAKLHQTNSIHYPDFKSGMGQDSVKRRECSSKRPEFQTWRRR